MINARAKGRYNENRSKKLLEEQGYLVEQVKGSSKWNKNVDIFNKFDLMGIKDKRFVFVQVKTNVYSRKVVEDLIEWGKEYLNEYCSMELHIWRDYKGLRTIWLEYPFDIIMDSKKEKKIGRD